MPIKSIFAVLCLSLAMSACTVTQDQSTHEPTNDSVSTPEPISLEGWPSETFSLPPGFAPTLPTGTESLRFAPGWRDPTSEGFWSYAFVMWINEDAPDAERVDELIETYYTGLMSVFAGNRGKDISATPVRVAVQRIAPNRFEAKMHFIDAFATFEPIDLRVVIETTAQSKDHAAVSIRVSPQPKEHEIWSSLETAITSIKSQAAKLEVLKERTEYESLDKQGVESLAHLAETRWEREFSGFTYQRVEQFSAGGESHWMSIWLHDTTGLEFVLVPGGKFQMGSPASEADRREDELQHWVTLDPFLIARSECTWKAWDTATAATDLKSERVEGSGQLPVSGFSPADVDTWCDTAGLMLPTEAQWEFMCRAGTTSAWAMGAKKSGLQKFANLGSLECPESWSREPWLDGYGIPVAPVGMFAANAFGLFDVHGNVCEWSRDHYFSYETPVERGTGIRPGISGERMARGGNFGGDASFARSAARFKCGSCDSPGANKGFALRWISPSE